MHDAYAAALPDVRAALAAIPAQAIPPISPVPPERLFKNQRSSSAGYPQAWFRPESATSGREVLGLEYLGFLVFDAWGRNHDEADAIRKAVMFLDGFRVGSHGTSYRLVYSVNSWSIVTEPTTQHLTMRIAVNYLEAA